MTILRQTDVTLTTFKIQKIVRIDIYLNKMYIFQLFKPFYQIFVSICIISLFCRIIHTKIWTKYSNFTVVVHKHDITSKYFQMCCSLLLHIFHSSRRISICIFLRLHCPQNFHATSASLVIRVFLYVMDYADSQSEARFAPSHHSLVIFSVQNSRIVKISKIRFYI